VNGPLIVDDVELVIHAAADGVGLAYLDEENAAPQLASASLVRVLEDWSTFPGVLPLFPQPAATGRCAFRFDRCLRL
jgi:DNA-binding transcriptional LysR family regulator